MLSDDDLLTLVHRLVKQAASTTPADALAALEKTFGGSGAIESHFSRSVTAGIRAAGLVVANRERDALDIHVRVAVECTSKEVWRRLRADADAVVNPPTIHVARAVVEQLVVNRIVLRWERRDAEALGRVLTVGQAIELGDEYLTVYCLGWEKPVGCSHRARIDLSQAAERFGVAARLSGLPFRCSRCGRSSVDVRAEAGRDSHGQRLRPAATAHR